MTLTHPSPDPTPRALTVTALLAGAVVTLVFNILHPLPGETLDETMQIMVDDGLTFWKLDHLMLALGLGALALGFGGLERLLRAHPGAPTRRLASAAIFMATAGWIIHFALDGFAWAEVVAAWDQAPAAQRAARADDAALLRHVTDATFPLVTVFFWGALLLFGTGLVRARAMPGIMAWSLPVIAVGPITLGVVALFAGFSATWDILFAVSATLTVVWAGAAGVWVWRGGARSVEA